MKGKVYAYNDAPGIQMRNNRVIGGYELPFASAFHEYVCVLMNRDLLGLESGCLR